MVAKAPLNALLDLGFVRRRIVFELRQRYYHELGISVPLGSDLHCPILFPDAWWSFTEIFVDQDYAPAFNLMPLPNRWLDLGCHAGFFSLYAVWKRAQRGATTSFEALLVDADRRVKEAVEALIAMNKLEGRLSFQDGLISDRPGEQAFVERGQMLSSQCLNELPAGTKSLVRTITASELTARLSPPYDLVKVDLEGGEYEFLSAYKSVLEATDHLLIEWHSWHRGGGGARQIHEMASENGFEPAGDVKPAHDVTIGGQSKQCGVFLYRRKK